MRIDAATIANLVWKLVAVANRTVTVTTNSDKSGYSLTAGSYSVRASSTQTGTATSATSPVTVTISSVTMTRAKVTGPSWQGNSTANITLQHPPLIQLATSTTVTGTALAVTNDVRIGIHVEELF